MGRSVWCGEAINDTVKEALEKAGALEEKLERKRREQLRSGI